MTPDLPRDDIFGDQRLRVTVADAPPVAWQERDWEVPVNAETTTQDIFRLNRQDAADLADPGWRIRHEEAAAQADQLLDEADARAAELWDDACSQAAALRDDAQFEAAEARDAAQKEAAEITRQARHKADALLAVAEQEAAKLRAALDTMTADLGRVAAYVTENLTNPGMPAVPRAPAARPVTPASAPGGPAARPVRPGGGGAAARPSARPAARPAEKPAARPAGRPAARPAEGPAGGKSAGRQRAAVRFYAILTSALVLFAVLVGVTEMELHGFAFFVFRATGTGETGPQGPAEDQGPGQPDAPKPTPSHITVKPSPHASVAVHRSR